MDDFTISPHVVQASGGKLVAAADEASAPLATSRTSAQSARPGFPGEASGPFAGALETLNSSETAILNAIRNIGCDVQRAAAAYDATDSSSGCRFDTISQRHTK